MRIDAHHHFWLYTPDEYTWIRTDVLKNDFTPDDLAPLLAGAGFDATVAVQARWKVEETTWLLALSDAYPFIAGVVGWLDVTGDDLPAQLERFGAHPKFCGVRSNIQTLPEDGMRPTDAFIRGLQTLADSGKSFDLLIRPLQLPLACAVAAAVPALRLVLDHIANPNIDGTLAPQWVNGIRQLAAFPNVTCKVSGMVTRATPLVPPHTAIPSRATFKPYLDVIFAAFGPDRLMIGSDWPVCTQAATYQQTVGVVLDYVANLSPAAQAAVLGETAKRAYNLA